MPSSTDSTTNGSRQRKLYNVIEVTHDVKLRVTKTRSKIISYTTSSGTVDRRHQTTKPRPRSEVTNMQPAEEICAARESVFDQINPLFNFCADPTEPVLKLQKGTTCGHSRKVSSKVASFVPEV